MYKTIVAVYGTLRQGQSNCRLSEASEYLGVDALNGYDLLQVSRSFPGIVPGDGRVVVELYEVSADTLRSMDILEGVAHGLYCRESAITEKGVECQVYVWGNKYGIDHPVIPSGDWVSR